MTIIPVKLSTPAGTHFNHTLSPLIPSLLLLSFFLLLYYVILCYYAMQGGTESIILAIKAHRDFYRQQHGITKPELIACVSAHAAVDKVISIYPTKYTILQVIILYMCRTYCAADITVLFPLS